MKLPDKINLLVTGTARRTTESEADLLLRTDDATLHFRKDSEFGKLAHALVDRYNERNDLLQENTNLKEVLQAIKARLDGEWDHPALLKMGLLSDCDSDILKWAERTLNQINTNEKPTFETKPI